MAHLASPAHYTRGSIEVWDFIRDQNLNYFLGNAIKYICRAGYKDSREDDLLKAIHYLQNELKHTTVSSEGVSQSIWPDEYKAVYAESFDR